MEARGYSRSEVFSGSGIAVEKLLNPSYLIDFAEYRAVVSNMIRLTGNQGIGLEVGAEADLADFGIVGHAMMSSNTARDALELWLRYSNSLVGLLMRLRLEEHQNGAWSLHIEEARPMGFLYNFGVEETLMIVVRLGAALTRIVVRPSLVELSYPAPQHHARYAELLGSTPLFNSSRTRMMFDSISLSHPVKGHDEEFNAICVRYCGRILQQIAAESPVISTVRGLLLTRAQRPPSLEHAAAELALSTRTLRRRLQREGYTYKQLIKEFRLDLAKEYLGISRMTAKETAYLLGFADANAFRRAFKTWTGKTVIEFQEETDGGTKPS